MLLRDYQSLHNFLKKSTDLYLKAFSHFLKKQVNFSTTEITVFTKQLSIGRCDDYISELKYAGMVIS